MARYIKRVTMSGFWLSPEVFEEDVIFEVEYEMVDNSFDNNFDWLITIKTILSATGVVSYYDYTDRVSHSPAFIEQLQDVILENMEM